MPTYVSRKSGTWYDNTAWRIVNDASFLDSNAATVAVTTTSIQSAAFTPGAVSVDGVILQLYSTRQFTSSYTPTGSFNVTLRNTTSAVDVNTVSIPISDIPDLPNAYATTQRGMGWIYVKFPTTSSLLAATNYAIRVSASVSNEIVCFRNATANNISRGLVTTSGGAPSPDTVNFAVPIITTPLTATGSDPYVTITFDVSNTNYWGSMYISNAKLTSLVASGTARYYNAQGSVYVGRKGELEWGTRTNPWPLSSPVGFKFNSTAVRGMGLVVHGGSLTMYAQPTTPYVRLSSDALSGSRGFTITPNPAGWESGDTIILSSTTQTPTQVEEETIFQTVTSNIVSSSVGLNFTHYGTPLIAADVANISHPLSIQVLTPAAGRSTFLDVHGFSSSIDISNTAFEHVYGTTTASCGITLCGDTTVALSASIVSSSIYNTSTYYNATSHGIGIPVNASSSGVNNVTLGNNVFYNLAVPYFNTRQFSHLQPIRFRDNIFIRCGTVTLRDTRGTDNGGNIFCSSRSQPLVMQIDVDTLGTGSYTAFNGWKIYSNSGSAAGTIVDITSTTTIPTQNQPITASMTIPNWYVFNNNAASGALDFENFTLGDIRNSITFNNLQMFGNRNSHVYIGLNVYSNLIFTGSYFWNQTSVSSSNFITSKSFHGIFDYYGPQHNMYFSDCGFGTTPLNATSSFPLGTFEITSLLNSNIIIANSNIQGVISYRSMSYGAYRRDVSQSPSIVFSKYNKIPNENYVEYLTHHIYAPDALVTYNGNATTRMTSRSSLNNIMRSPEVRIPVKTGQTCTVSVIVMKDTTYSGFQPRLMYKFNPIVGNFIPSDIIADEMTVGPNIWETLTYTTSAAIADGVMEFYIEGSSVSFGRINFYGWSTNLSNETRNTPVVAALLGIYAEPDMVSGSIVTGSSNETSYTFIG